MTGRPNILFLISDQERQRDWLPRSGFALDDRPLLERYVEPCSERTRGAEAVIELLIPIRARQVTTRSAACATVQ